MRNIYRLISMLCMLVFIGSVAFTIIYIFGLKDAVVNTLSLDTIKDVPKLQPLIFQLSLYTFVQVVSALAAVFFLILGTRQVAETRVVYIEKKVDKSKKEEEEETQQQEADRLAMAMAEADNKLARIENLATTITNKAHLTEKLLQALCAEMEAVQGALFLTDKDEEKKMLHMVSSYAYFNNENTVRTYEFGEGLIGQVAKEARMLNITAVPEGYITILSGLGNSTPSQLLICPILVDEAVAGIVEVASFKSIAQPEEKLVQGVCALLSRLIADKSIVASEQEAM